MSVQNVKFVDQQVLTKMNPAQIKENVKAGIWAQDADGNYYVVNNDNKGISVESEKKANTLYDKPNTSVTTESSINAQQFLDATNQIITKSNVTLDKAITLEDIKGFAQEIGLNVDEEGNFSAVDKDTQKPREITQQEFQALQNKIQAYCDAERLHEVELPEGEEYQEFIIQKDGKNYVKGSQRQAFVDKLSGEEIGYTQTQNETTAREKIDVPITGTMTTTTTKTCPVKPAEGVNLRTNKEAREKLENDYRDYLTGYADDPKNVDDVRRVLAQEKYADKMAKKMEELSYKYQTNQQRIMAYRNSGDEALKNVIDNELKELDNLGQGHEDNVLLKAWNTAHPEAQISEITDENRAQAEKCLTDTILLQAYQKAHPQNTGAPELRYAKAFPEGDRGRELREIAKYDFLAQADEKFNGATVLFEMAMNEVVPKELSDGDKKYFVKHEAARQTDADVGVQNEANTRSYFSSEAKKAGEASSKDHPEYIHKDIGDDGRYLVMQCPDAFCDVVESGGDFTVNGKNYKFNEAKWKAQMKNLCDVEGMKDGMRDDTMLTLSDGRHGWTEVKFKCADGEERTLDQIWALKDGKKADGKCSNRDLNRIRDFVKSAGWDVDSNHTLWKKFGHIMKNIGIGAGLGAITAGLGSFLGGAVSTLVEAGSHVVTRNGITDGYNFKTDSQTVTTTFTYEIDGEVYTRTVDHILPGQEYNLPGQEWKADFEVKDYKTKMAKPKPWKAAGIGAATGAAGGLIAALPGVSKVQDKGTGYHRGKDFVTVETDEKDYNFTLGFAPDDKLTVLEKEIDTTIESRKFVPGAGYYQYLHGLYKDIPTDVPQRVLINALKNKWKEMGNQGGIPKDIPGVEIEFEYNGKQYKLELYDDWKTRPIDYKFGGRGGLGEVNLGSKSHKSIRVN